MESGNGGASSKGVLVPVPESSDVFHNSILAPLKSAYLYEESKQSFEYKSAFLVKNPALEEKYNAFRAQRREAGYSEEELKESYGFLLFGDVNKANALGETGVLTGNSTCTTLGDPSDGIYISMYSDCLDLNRWYHGKSGYIAIIRLTKGRVKRVSENYTQTFTASTLGFDCHVSEQLPSVSANTSSFLAFERTQYYMYELLDDGSNEAAKSPSAACPYAIVSFSYTDTKATLVATQEKSEEKKPDPHYFAWRGQLQIDTQFYDAGLQFTSGTLIPAKLPPVVKVVQVISMLDLRQLLPRAVFETCYSGEVFLDGLFCSQCKFVSSEEEQTNSLSLLLFEVKEKDVALIIPLNDGGFLILVHSSNFLTYDETGSSVPEVFQGLFVFPDSRVIQRDTKFGHRKPLISSEILRVLPVLSYAEGEVEKTPTDPSEDMYEVLTRHMQSYAALINPGLELSPSRDVSIFADQYDVLDAHKHLYTSPEWSNRAWQSLKSYLSKPVSFQLPLAKASEILMVGQEDQIEDLDDDVYICLSSPEEVSANVVGTGSEYHLAGQKSSVNDETSVDSCTSSVEAPVDLRNGPQNVVTDELQAEGSDKESKKSELNDNVMRTKNLLIPSTSNELPAELIVSITSAQRTDESVISTECATKFNDFQIPDFATAKIQTASANPMNDETVNAEKLLDSPEVKNLPKAKCRKVRRGHSKGRKKVSKACIETPSLPTEQICLEYKNEKNGQKDNLAKESVNHQQPSKTSITDWRTVSRRKRIFGKLSSRNKKVRSRPVGLTLTEERRTVSERNSLESAILMDLEACPLRKKTERWDLKPVVSECGRILVPHGSVDIADKIQSLKDKLNSTENEEYLEKMLVVASEEAHDKVKMLEKSSTAPETAADEIGTTTSKAGGNHLKNIDGNINPEHSILRPSDDGNDSSNVHLKSSCHSSENDGSATTPLETIQEKYSDTLPPAKCSTKGEILLSKLKSVLLKGKRKMGLLMSGEITADAAQDTEPSLKMNKVDSDAGILKSNDAITSVQDTNLGFKEVSKMLSVDPLFAYALGLTPKEIPKMVQKNDLLGFQQRTNSSQTQEQTIFEKQSKIIQRPPSIFPRRGRIKTLKKHQDISAENVKQKWWLHFQTPACFASEKLKNKECPRDNSVRKTVKEKKNNTCSSTDALNLLADLALSASHDQVPPQPGPALGRKPETSLKKCDLTKAVTSVDQESVLHTLLRQPATRSIQPHESPSPSRLVGDSELVGLVSEEHSYSLPPSSSLPLGLPGTLFQVSPLSGATRLLHHQKIMLESENRTLHPSVIKEDTSEQDCRTPDLKRLMMRRRQFRQSRTFVSKDGSVQVTRQWKDDYDFHLDSKFTNDSKDRAIIRALHGPWDYSVQDTSEEVRLIVHMWIGLFYSRSTARFFHIDSDLTYPSLEEGDCLEMNSGMVPVSPDSSSSKALDLSKKDDSVFNEGSEILDLSFKNSNAEDVTSDLQVNKKETSVSGDSKKARRTLKTQSSKGIQEASPTQIDREIAVSTKINESNDVRSTYEKQMTCNSLQTPGQLEQTNVSSFKDEPLIPVEKAIESVSFQPENKKDGTGNSEAAEVGLVQQHGMDSSTTMTDDEVDSNKEASDEFHPVQHDEMGSKFGENSEVKEKTHQEGNIELYPKKIHTGDDSTNKESGMVCKGKLLVNEKQLTSEEPMVVSQSKAETVNEYVDGCTVNESEVIQDDGLDDKNICVSAMEVNSNVSNQPLSGMCDGQDSVKKKCTKYNCQTNLNEPPPQADNEEQDFHDLQLRKLCENGRVLTSENTLTEKAPCTPSKTVAIHDEPAVDEQSENSVCFVNKANTDESCSLDTFHADESVPQTNDSLQTGIQKTLMAGVHSRSVDHEDCETKSADGERKVDSQTPNELSIHQPHSPQCELIKSGDELALTKETDLRRSKSNEDLEKIHNRVVIPFIGVDISQEDTVLPLDPHSQGKVEEIVEVHKEIPSVSETTYTKAVQPTEVCGTSQMYSKKVELSSGKILLIDVPKTNLPEVLGRESDDRCPTPTMDEKPYESFTSSVPGSKISKNMTKTCFSRSSMSRGDEIPTEQKPCQKSTNIGHPHSHHDLHPDLEQRTLRVLQSINEFLSKSSHTDKSTQIEAANMKPSLDQAPNSSSNYILTCLAQSHYSSDFKDQKIINSQEMSAVFSASNLQEGESSGDFLKSPLKSEIKEVPGVGLQLKKTDPSLHQNYFKRKDKFQETSFRQYYGHPNSSPPSTECYGAIKPIDHDPHTTTSQTNLSHEPRSHSQRPVMAVKPSKSDESQAECISKDTQMENSIIAHFTKNEQTKIPLVTSTKPTTMLLEKKTDNHKESSDRLNDDKQEAGELSAKSSLLSCVTDSKLDKATFSHLDTLYQYEGRDIPQLNKISSSSLPVQSLASTKSSYQFVDGNKGSLTNHLADEVGQTIKELEVNQKDCLEASTSLGDYKDDDVIDESLYLGPESSLTCTVYNTSRKRCRSFLEQLSQRCLQDDPTEASMEQECLIFSEKMKQLLKRSKWESIQQPEAHDKLNLSCPSPVSVHFSRLEEQEDTEDHLDAQSLFGQKIKVDMSDREELAGTTKEEKNLHSQTSSRGRGTSIENAGVSSVTAKCARLYDEMMNDVCAIRKVPSNPKHSRMDRGYPKTKSSNYFDFCDQMKRKMDESFRSDLNSVVKKSCKTKYRFYVLVTSDDTFFEETKVLLEAEGHTAVEPSEFFLGEGSPSSLLIILRNEDIAERICEVPHLLELKKSPHVQFAGIDEPDDVVNLTHQELFSRGGFILFDRAALEPLSLCNMKKLSEVLRELSKQGRWKWMLHYKDSRWLKENARLNAEAKEKKHFLNWCQDAGILEVLPYHECDLMSRDQPDYLTCLARLQVQNISARYTVFITDATADGMFESNGILTTTFHSFMACSTSEAFSV